MDFEALLGLMKEATGFEGICEGEVVVGRWVVKHLVVEEETIFRGNGVYQRTEQRVENMGFWICEKFGMDLSKLSK